MRCNYTEIDLVADENSSILRISNVSFRLFPMKNRSGSWYFSAYFYDSYRHRVDKVAWRGEEGLWCNPVQRWTSDRVLGKDPRNASGHHPWSFYEITIDHRRQLHCNYIVHCPLALSITHHGLFLYSSHERVTCGIAFFSGIANRCNYFTSLAALHQY